MNFTERLRQVMEERKVSMTELAREIGTRQSTISNWMDRGTIPAADTALRVAMYLDVDLVWLITGEHEETKYNDNLKLSAPERELIRYYRELTVEQKEFLFITAQAQYNINLLKSGAQTG